MEFLHRLLDHPMTPGWLVLLLWLLGSLLRFFLQPAHFVGAEHEMLWCLNGQTMRRSCYPTWSASGHAAGRVLSQRPWFSLRRMWLRRLREVLHAQLHANKALRERALVDPYGCEHRLIGVVQMQAPRLDACVRTSPKVWLDFARILVSVSWFYLHCLCSNFLLWILWSKKCQLPRLQRVQLRILWPLPTGTKGRNCFACYARNCSESCGLLKLRTFQRSRKWVMDDMDDSFNDGQGV